MGEIGVGGVRWTGTDADLAVTFRPAVEPGSGIAPFAGFPPTGGGWWEYHVFSAHVTMDPPP
jgi:hypothetical protein